MEFHLVDLLLLVFIFLIFFKSSALKGKELYDDNFSIRSTNALRGILAVWVVLHHISGTVDFVQSRLLFTGSAGILPVSAFFFLSGYAMMFQVINKKDALKSFFSKRLPKVVIPLLTMYIVFLIKEKIEFSFSGEPRSFVSLFVSSLDNLSHGYPTVLHSWFAIELIAIYLLFFAAFRIGKKSKKLGMVLLFLFCGGLMIAAMLLSVLRGWATIWYTSLMVFPLGSLYCFKKQKIDSFIRKRYALCFIVVSVLMLAALLSRFVIRLLPHADLFGVGRSFGIAVISAAFFVVISMKISFTSPLWTFLGKISYEIYLTHGLAIVLLSKVPYFVTAGQDLLFSIAVLALTIILAYAVNALNRVIFKLLKIAK